MLKIVCIILFFAVIWLLVKLVRLKRNIRRFSGELERFKADNYAQPVKVSDFDNDLVRLAIGINQLAEHQQSLVADAENERERMNNIISGVSHDFRTPLTASLGYLQMIEKSGELSEKNMKYLSIVVQKEKYLKELSDEFFELSKLKNDVLDEREQVNLSNLLNDMLMEQFEWLSSRGISPEIDVADGIVIESSMCHLTRIIQNLLSNAEKYAVSRFGAVLSETDGALRLEVYNDVEDAQSINAEQVFQPFYKAESRSQEGSGLGLYVVKELCERLGFTVSAKLSKDGIFSVTIKR